MKKFAIFAAASGAALALAACGSSDNASSDAQADTVEMPADEALVNPAIEPPAAEVVEDAASDAAQDAQDAASSAEAAAADAQAAADAVAADTPAN